MNEEIIQIIPAPSSLKAIYEDPHDPNKTIELPITCLALVNIESDERSHQSVFPMTIVSDGSMIYAADVKGFLEVVHTKADS